MKFGKILTVTVLLAHTLAADFVENDYLVSFAMLQHGSFDGSTGYIRRADPDRTLVVHEKNLVKIQRSIDLGSKTVYVNAAALLYFELLSCNIND